MPDITDLQIGQGETLKILVQLRNLSNNNTPLDITEYTFTGQIRENYTTDEVAATFTFDKVTPNSSGSLFIKLPPATTSQLYQRKYVYDIYMTSGSVDPVTRRILEGGLTVRPAVTRQ
jgi:hypothetical protein